MSEEKNTDLSKTIEGDCPKCGLSLTFDTKDRQKGSNIICPECSEKFSIDNAKNPKQKELKEVVEGSRGKKKKQNLGELSYLLAIISVILYLIPCTSIFAVIGAPLALLLGIIDLKRQKASLSYASKQTQHISPYWGRQKSKAEIGILIASILIIILSLDIYNRMQNVLEYGPQYLNF